MADISSVPVVAKASQRWLIGSLLFFVFIFVGVAGGLGYFLWERNANLTEVKRQLSALESSSGDLQSQKDLVQKELDREKHYDEIAAKEYYTTSTYEDVKSVVVGGKEWRFVHECVGGPKLDNGFIRCEWGNSSLYVISPEGLKKLLAKSDGGDYPYHRSYLRRVELLPSPSGPSLLIAYGNYGELDGRNELGGTIEDAFFNYLFQFRDQTIRKIENFPIDEFAQSPLWNGRGDLMAYVPVFCHPECVPVPLVVYDLTADKVKYFSGPGAYGSSGDLDYGRDATSTSPYWSSIEWVNATTLRGVYIESGQRKTHLWNTNDSKQTLERK